jgi:exosortase A
MRGLSISWIRSVTVLRSTPTGQPIAASLIASGWRPALVLIGIATLVFAVVFQRDISAAVGVWIESTAYNHCFLILPLVGFLLWERRAIIASVSPRPAFWPLLLMPLLSAVWLVAALLDLQEGRQLALVAMFEVVLLVALGPRLVWLLLAPFLFLFFLVPSGAFLVPSLQKITADISVAGLHILQIPVFSDGFMIEIPEGSFEVAEACAGLRFLIASTVFGCFFAVVMYRSFLRRMFFILLSVAVPIAANGLRALGIVVLAHFEGNATAVEADHVLYGWIFFTLVIMVLIAIGMTFAQKADRAAPVRSAGFSKSPLWRFAVAIAAAMLLAVAGPAYAARLDALYPLSPLPRAHAPLIAPPWHVVSDASPDWRPMVVGANREFVEEVQEPGSGIVTRYVALYRLRAIGNMLTTTENRLVDNDRWRIAEYGRAEASLGGKRTAVRSAEIVSGQRRRLVWSFYVVGDGTAAGLLETKLLQARAVLLEREPVGAFVVISASMNDPNDPAERQLTRFLAASEPLAEYLASVRR